MTTRADSIPTLAAVKNPRNLRPRGCSVFRYIRKEIKLAKDAMIVPSPPRLLPMIKLPVSDVKLDKSTAAGTLLMTWLKRMAATASLDITTSEMNWLTTLILPKLPEKIKKQIKVSNRE
jgi:hypothetical protein